MRDHQQIHWHRRNPQNKHTMIYQTMTLLPCDYYSTKTPRSGAIQVLHEWGSLLNCMRSSASNGCMLHTKIGLVSAYSNCSIAYARYIYIASFVGSTTPFAGFGFVMMGAVSEYKHRGVKQSLHQTTNWRYFPCVILYCSDSIDLQSRAPILTPPQILLFRLRFCKDGWCSSVKGCATASSKDT